MSANVETMFYTREKPWHGLEMCIRDRVIVICRMNWDKCFQNTMEVAMNMQY